ncbi:MAG: outer membrane protein assembly factor BamA [Pseudomonadota bacterium]|jgi:outer membrane protein insertion porin family
MSKPRVRYTALLTGMSLAVGAAASGVSAQTAPPPAPPTAAAPAAAPSAVAAPPQVAVVRHITVKGNERLDAGTVISYLPIGVGDAVDAARIDLALKALARTDLFSDERIDLNPATGELTVRVVENPIINQVLFEGNSALGTDKLKDEVTIHPRSIFTKAHVLQDVQRIVELYRRSGRIAVQVSPKIIELPQKRVDLVFEISEGPKTGILRVNFLGNKSFSENALRDVVVTKESRWYHFFTSNDNYDPDRIEYDREQLRKFYTNKGYYDFRVISSTAELQPDQKNFVVTYTLEEGPKYKFGKLKVETDLKKLNANVMRALLPIREGQLYQGDKIETAVDSLTFAAGAAGFAFVDIRPRYSANPKTRTVDVTFDVKEGPRVYVERIEIVGNTRTLDYVIRREMRIAEGDAYNRVLVDRSKIEVKRLDFFKTVDIEQLPGSAPDRTVLRVKVQEQPTGELSFGAGYSSVDQLLLDVGISEHNFRGRGEDVRLRASVGSLRQQIDAAFTEPRFMGRDLRAGIDLYSYRYDYSSQAGFSSQSTGLSLNLGFPLNVNAYFSPRYSLHADRVSVSSGSCSAGVVSVVVCDQTGSFLASQLGYTLGVDMRNDPRRPSRGFYANLKQDFAGVGGDVRYLRTELEGGWYYGFNADYIVSVLASGGYVGGWGGDTIRINDRFFKGGNTFRGFQIAGIGPRDTQFDEALGGKLFAISTVELAFPNPLPEQYGIRTALFTDVGTLGLVDKSAKMTGLNGAQNPKISDTLGLRGSAGLSVFWTSPMGPIRLDFSQVFSKESYDKVESFRFSTNTQF